MNKDVYNAAIKRFIASVLMEMKGCNSIMPSCLDAFAEICEKTMMGIARQLRLRMDHCGILEPTLRLYMTTFETMGLQYLGLSSFAHRPGRTITLMPRKSNPKRVPSFLRVVPYQPHKANIPKHLPPLPDPHTYVATPAKQKVSTDYVKLRQKSAIQAHKLSQNLSKFTSKTSNSINLLGENSPDQSFLVIKPGPRGSSYLNALIPTDQIFDFKLLENNYAACYPNIYAAHHKYFEEKSNQSNIDNPFLKPCKLPFADIENDDIKTENCTDITDIKSEKE